MAVEYPKNLKATVIVSVLIGLVVLAFLTFLSSTDNEAPAAATTDQSSTSAADTDQSSSDSSQSSSDSTADFVSNMQSGVNYTSADACSADSSTVCMTEAQYKAVCEAATGVATNAVTAYELMGGSGVDQMLANNGDWSVQGISWDDSSKTCGVDVSLSGDVYGTTHEDDINGRVGGFRKDDQGKIWVFSFS